MKKKIYIRLVGIATLAIVLTLLFVSSIFYEILREQVLHDLRTEAALLRAFSHDEIVNGNIPRIAEEDLRITLIGPDGVVQYDNSASMEALDNHSDREEVREALEQGEGYAVRRSKTMDMDTLYYSTLMDSGEVLRVSMETDNLWGIYSNVIPATILLLLLLFILCMVLSHFLTIKLIKPIEYLANNLDGSMEIGTYSELKPFINTIYKQHDDIIRSARIRQDFTANVSHELKTPLTAISGYAQLIENGMAGERDVVRFSREIHKSSTRLLTLINDIIRLSELDSMDASDSFEVLDISAVVKECVETLQVNAHKHNVSISFTGESAEIMAEKGMLEELLFNLCDNAIRYNNEGGSVMVSVKKEKERVVLTVQDTGIGIPKEHQERIFERFYRVDKSRSKSTGGTGLGLAIVKHIVAQFDARIELWSEVSRGTRIQVTFPGGIGSR